MVEGAPAVEVVVRRTVVGGVVVVEAGLRVVDVSTLLDAVVVVSPAPGASSSAAPPAAWRAFVLPVVDSCALPFAEPQADAASRTAPTTAANRALGLDRSCGILSTVAAFFAGCTPSRHPAVGS